MYKVFFATITTWSLLAQNCIFTKAFLSTYHTAGIVETHAVPGKDGDLQAKCRAHGLNAIINPVMQYQDTSGSHGIGW